MKFILFSEFCQDLFSKTNKIYVYTFFYISGNRDVQFTLCFECLN